MSIKPLSEQFQHNTAVALIVCFLVLLWLPTLDFFFGLDRTPQPNENRALTRFPVLPDSLAAAHDFPTSLEMYFRDHFGFRNRLIRWERRWKHDLFKESASPDVIMGRNGWLFFSGDYMMEHFEGLRVFPAEELRNWQTLLEKRRDWLARRGIKYLFVITPDKQSIYPELLPEWLAGLRSTNKLDQFVAHMKAHSTVEVLDLRPALLEAKRSALTYLQTDTHWNTYGGFVAYQALVNALRRQLPGLPEPLPLTDFNRRPTERTGGDLTRMMGQPNLPRDTNAILFSLRTPRPKLTVVDASDRLPSKKRRPLTEPQSTRYEGVTGKAIVFHDSFACTWYPFLGYHFQEVVYIWQYEWEAAFIEREKPAVVIDEMLERLFLKADPVELLEKDALRD